MTSEDGKTDATVEELAALADDPQEDVAETPAPEIEETLPTAVEEEETIETADANALSDTDLALIDKYGSLDESERIEKIQKMFSSGRKDQVNKAKILMDSFDLEIEEETISNTDEAVAKSLEKMGLSIEEIKELRERKEIDNRKDAVEIWAKTLGATTTSILKNKDFVKAYHTFDGDVQSRVDSAIKVYLKNNPVSNASKKLATLKLSSTTNSVDTPSKKTEVDLESLLSGKSLDEIDLSKL